MNYFETFVKEYGTLGLVAALALRFAYTDFWPFIRDKVFPEYARERQRERDAAHQREREIQEASQRREDRLYAILESTTHAISELRVTIADTHEQMITHTTQQTTTIQLIAEDLAALYGRMQLDQPSRGRRTGMDRTIGSKTSQGGN